jgi:hypothetical protein
LKDGHNWQLCRQKKDLIEACRYFFTILLRKILKK